MGIENQVLQSESLSGETTKAVIDVALQDNMSIMSLMMEASLTVQLVMFMLFLASLYSWSIIFSKSLTLRRERRLTAQFEREFWSGGSMQSLYNQWGAETKRASGMSEIFVAGYREYQRLSERGYANNNDLLDAVQRAMRVELSREIEHLESQIPFLATVGSTSPYVGVFGTVWGIMIAYNRFSYQVEKLIGQYEIFMEEFISIVNRQLATEKD